MTDSRTAQTTHADHPDENREQEEPAPVVLTVDELAELLRVERKTVYSAIRRGEIPGVQRVGRTIRIGRAAVVSWLNSGQGSVSRSKRRSR